MERRRAAEAGRCSLHLAFSVTVFKSKTDTYGADLRGKKMPLASKDLAALHACFTNVSPFFFKSRATSTNTVLMAVALRL